jgi:hypothetical protein
MTGAGSKPSTTRAGPRSRSSRPHWGRWPRHPRRVQRPNQVVRYRGRGRFRRGRPYGGAGPRPAPSPPGPPLAQRAPWPVPPGDRPDQPGCGAPVRPPARPRRRFCRLGHLPPERLTVRPRLLGPPKRLRAVRIRVGHPGRVPFQPRSYRPEPSRRPAGSTAEDRNAGPDGDAGPRWSRQVELLLSCKRHLGRGNVAGHRPSSAGILDREGAWCWVRSSPPATALEPSPGKGPLKPSGCSRQLLQSADVLGLWAAVLTRQR